jgi:hypothetical protein
MAGLRLRVPPSLLASTAAWTRALWHYTSSDTPFDTRELARKIQEGHQASSGGRGIGYQTALNWAMRVERAYEAGKSLQTGGDKHATNSMLRSPHLAGGDPWMVRVLVVVKHGRSGYEGGVSLSIPFQVKPTLEDVRREVDNRMASILPGMGHYDENFAGKVARADTFVIQSLERR